MVSEASALKFENFSLKLQLLENQFRVLVNDQRLLLESMRDEAGAGPEDVYNPATREFVKKEL